MISFMKKVFQIKSCLYHCSVHDQLMANGADGESILLVQKHVEVEPKIESVLAQILHHLEEDFNVTDFHLNKENVILTLVQVFIFHF